MTNPLFQQKQWVFDRWAPRYDWLFPSVLYQAIHQRLLEYVDLPDRPQVLDLGCGTGRLLNRLAAQNPTLMGTGFDLSPEMIRQARRSNHHPPQLIFVRGNAEALPFADEQFDAVFNTISFLHYPNPIPVLQQVQRVLRPHGRYYLVDFTPSALMRPTAQVNLPGTVRFYSPQERERLGKEAGLSCLNHFYLLGPVLLTIFKSQADLSSG